MFTVNYENAATYKTMFIAACHCNVDQWRQLLALADNKAAYYCHRTTQSNDTGIIVRLEPLCDDIGETLAADGIDDELIELLTDIRENGIDAVHFDADADLLAYKPWYTDDGAKVIPLAYEIEYVNFYSLTPEQRDQVYQDRDGTGYEFIDNNYFVLNDQVYCMADFMRIGDGGMADYGFIGVMGESNTSALFISLSDNSDFVNVVRVIG